MCKLILTSVNQTCKYRTIGDRISNCIYPDNFANWAVRLITGNWSVVNGVTLLVSTGSSGNQRVADLAEPVHVRYRSRFITVRDSLPYLAGTLVTLFVQYALLVSVDHIIFLRHVIRNSALVHLCLWLLSTSASVCPACVCVHILLIFTKFGF